MSERKKRQKPELPPGAPVLYTPAQVAVVLNLHEDTVREIFRDEAGVFKHSRPAVMRRKRCYETLRISHETLMRVIEARSKGRFQKIEPAQRKS